MKKTTLGIIATTLLLSPAFGAEDLGEIIVTSTTKLPQKIKNSTANVTVITAEDIRERGYQSLTEAISHISGISVSNNGGSGTTSSIFIRGMKTEKILVLLDGITLNNPSSTDGQAFFEHIPLSNIERIEIVKGGLSSTWGADASAGVINIITKQPKDGLLGNLSTMIGSYGTRQATASLGYKDDRFSGIVNLSKITTDGFSAKAPRDAEADGYDNTAANIKLGYNFYENHNLFLNYNYIDAHSEYDGSFSVLGADDPDAYADTIQKDLAIGYEYRGETYHSTLKYTKSKSDRFDHSTSSSGDGNLTYKATIEELSWINQYEYNANSSMRFGVEVKSTEGVYQYNSFPETKNKFDDKAAFVGIEHSMDGIIGGKTILNASLRRDMFEIFDNQWSYRIGVKHFHKNIDGLITSFNYYKSIDAPNSYQLANAVGGKILKPDTTKGYDLTVSYKNISMTYFSNETEDRLSYHKDSNWTKSGYINAIGTEKIKGIEISGSYSFDSLIVSANYTHLFTYEDENGELLTKRAKDTLNLNFDYYLNDDTYFGLSGQYIGDRIEYNYGSYDIKAKTGNYGVINASFGTKITPDLSLKIHAKNIFDKKYETTSGYSTEGRSIYATMEYRF